MVCRASSMARLDAAPRTAHRDCSVDGRKCTQVTKGDTKYIGPVLCRSQRTYDTDDRNAPIP